MVDPTPLEELVAASNRLVRTVDGIDDGAYAAPSLLPGWTRAHVVAHLALNAEGLGGALSGVVNGEPTPMYSSQDARDADIEELATASPAALRSRLLGAVTDLTDAVTALPPEDAPTRVERTPGGPTFAAGAVGTMREREVEVHHVDLDLGYTRHDWPAAFVTRLVGDMTTRRLTVPVRVVATDLDRTWQSGDGGPTVTGTGADLAWWLTGRGDGQGLTCTESSGEGAALPRIEAW